MYYYAYMDMPRAPTLVMAAMLSPTWSNPTPTSV